MIISASRRTDIPAYYSEWLFSRLKAGYVLVRNPMNPRQVSRVSLSPDLVDGIVFWTKDPIPMIKRLRELEPYTYYFQFTLTPYGRDVEPNLPPKDQVLIPAFEKLSQILGRERVVWRYDPIFFSKRYTMEYHCRAFQLMAERLSGCTEKCTVSFLDFYRKTERNMRSLKVQKETGKLQLELLERFAETAKAQGLYIDTCAETGDFSRLGIGRASCIDCERLERIGNYRLRAPKDPNQRPECGCAVSIDIGAYDTCRSGCLYCYANENSAQAEKNAGTHDPASPLLFGKIGPDDVIKDRKMEVYRDYQLSFL